MSSLFNHHMEIVKNVTVLCRKCGIVKSYDFNSTLSNKLIVDSFRRDGWKAGPKGMLCPRCKKVKE